MIFFWVKPYLSTQLNLCLICFIETSRLVEKLRTMLYSKLYMKLYTKLYIYSCATYFLEGRPGKKLFLRPCELLSNNRKYMFVVGKWLSKHSSWALQWITFLWNPFTHWEELLQTVSNFIFRLIISKHYRYRVRGLKRSKKLWGIKNYPFGQSHHNRLCFYRCKIPLDDSN